MNKFKNKAYDRSNPFYDNHVFSSADTQRKIFSKWKYWWLFFFPTYAQISIDSNDIFYFKIVGGRYYLWDIENKDK